MRRSTAADSASVDHALLDHEADVARDLAPRVGERARGLAGRAAVLDVDEAHAAAAEREGQRDLAADPAGPEDGDRAVARVTRGSLP